MSQNLVPDNIKLSLIMNREFTYIVLKRISCLFLLMIPVILLVTSCFDDNFKDTINKESKAAAELNVPNQDKAPGPVGDSIITITDITSTSLKLSWQPALDGDDKTPQDQLLYTVIQSTSNNIYSITDAEKNGIVIMDWSADTVEFTVTGLMESTAYYFNVIVKDADGLTNIYLATFEITEEPELTGPIPGEYGIITTTGMTTSQVELYWHPATDADSITPQSRLEYKIIRSNSSNINTAENAEANGTLVADWTEDISSTIATGLSESTTYYFNVIVRDEDENKAVYAVISITTTGNVIYIYNAGTHKGNMVSVTTNSIRDDIDKVCQSAKTDNYPTMPCSSVRAFISISEADDIADMTSSPISVPSTWKIKGPENMKIADSWSDMLDGTIDDGLANAEIAPGKWWSGSDSHGNLYYSEEEDDDDSAMNCGSWMSTSEKGTAGHHNATDDKWLDENSPNCSASRYLLCICW